MIWAISIIGLLLAIFAWWNHRHGIVEEQKNGLKASDILKRQELKELKQFIKTVDKLAVEEKKDGEEITSIFKRGPRVRDIVRVLNRSRGEDTKTKQDKPTS